MQNSKHKISSNDDAITGDHASLVCGPTSKRPASDGGLCRGSC